MRLNRVLMGEVRELAIQTVDELDNQLVARAGIRLTDDQIERIIENIVNEAVDTVLA